MPKLDPRIEAVRAEYGLSADDFWQLPQSKNTWCVKHSALEVVAAQAGIIFDPPTIIEANGAAGVAAVCVSGSFKDRKIWSIGEANPKNSRNAYPWAMAEKRAIDRVVLKLVGIHGLVYSDTEVSTSDVGEFAQQQPKADSRSLFTDTLAELRKHGNEGRAALRGYWTSEVFAAAFETMPTDWQKILIDEKNAFIASYPKATARIDPNETLDRQYAETMNGVQ